MQESLKQQIQKRKKDPNWDKEIAARVLKSYQKEKNKTLFLKFNFALIIFFITLIGNFLSTHTIDLLQESLELHESLELSFFEP